MNWPFFYFKIKIYPCPLSFLWRMCFFIIFLLFFGLLLSQWSHSAIRTSSNDNRVTHTQKNHRFSFFFYNYLCKVYSRIEIVFETK